MVDWAVTLAIELVELIDEVATKVGKKLTMLIQS